MRGVARGMLALVLVAGAAYGMGQPQEAQASSGQVAVTDGSFSWGVRASIRNYLENFPHTEGSVTASNGATYATGDPAIVFSSGTGWVNEQTQTAELAFDGEVEMRGFGQTWLWFDNLRVLVSDGKANIVVDLIESWQVQSEVADLVLATFPAPDLAVVDGSLATNLAEGVFSTAAWDEHLPKLGGEPTYGPPNDQVDDAAIAVSTTSDPAPTDPQPTDPVPTDPSPTDPQPTDPSVPVPTTPPIDEGPYGVSKGEPLSGTEAYITVTPGYALTADGATTVRVEGFGFNPGPEVPPGEGTGGLYVGFGQAAEPGTENWRRSEGGLSGPGADFDYGIPRFVANQNSGDADVADAVMDSSGYWSFTAELPGSTIPSFFGGGPMNCLESECAVFSFGAHGVVNAANEAYTSFHFQGEDESDWPPRDEEDDAPPTGTPTLPDESALTNENRGNVSILSTTGRQLTAQVSEELAGSYVGAAIYSEPSFAGWVRVNSTGRIDVSLPAELAQGDHKLALLDEEGNVVGWAPFVFAADPAPDPDPDPDPDPNPGQPDRDKQPRGESSGTNAFGATLTVSPAYDLQDEGQVVTLTGSGFPTTSPSGNTFGGAYILFGWIDQEQGAAWAPSQGGTTGFSYVYVEGEDNQSMVSYPGNTTVPGYPMMDDNGNWEAEYTIPASQFTAFQQEIDCYRVQCGVITIGAHGQANEDLEVFTPVFFDVDGAAIDDDARPDPVAGANGPTQNSQQQTPVGQTVGTGILAASNGRTLVFVGLIVFAFGVFAMAMIWASPRLRRVR